MRQCFLWLSCCIAVMVIPRWYWGLRQPLWSHCFSVGHLLLPLNSCVLFIWLCHAPWFKSHPFIKHMNKQRRNLNVLEPCDYKENSHNHIRYNKESLDGLRSCFMEPTSEIAAIITGVFWDVKFILYRFILSIHLFLIEYIENLNEI